MDDTAAMIACREDTPFTKHWLGASCLFLGRGGKVCQDHADLVRELQATVLVVRFGHPGSQKTTRMFLQCFACVKPCETAVSATSPNVPIPLRLHHPPINDCWDLRTCIAKDTYLPSRRARSGVKNSENNPGQKTRNAIHLRLRNMCRVGFLIHPQ